MEQPTHIGLDVHRDTVAVAILRTGAGLKRLADARRHSGLTIGTKGIPFCSRGGPVALNPSRS